MRKRPVTYAEALDALETKQTSDLQETYVAPELPEINQKTNTRIVNHPVNELPSGGKPYNKTFEIGFAPLTFGDVKYLSGSELTEAQSIDFFLSKIHTNGDKGEITFYDFFFIVILIKLSTFGENNYNINFECNKCGHVIKRLISNEDMEFDALEIELPISIKLDGEENGPKIDLSPMTISNYRDLVEQGLKDDYDEFIARQITNVSYEEAIVIIKEQMNGVYANLLDSVDVLFYHGTKNYEIVCDGLTESEEVCGANYAIPFRDFPKIASTTDELKEHLRHRINISL